MWENVLAVIHLKSGTVTTQGLTVSKYQSVNEDFFFQLSSGKLCV